MFFVSSKTGPKMHSTESKDFEKLRTREESGTFLITCLALKHYLHKNQEELMPLKKYHVDKLNRILWNVNVNILLSKPIVNGQLNASKTHQPT